MRAVVDTNAWASGLIIPGGTPGRILDAVRRGDLEPVASWEVARELVEVLRRPEIRRYGVTEADVDDVIAVLGPLLPDVDVEVEIHNPDDAVVVGAALAGAAEVIVSGDRDLLDDADLRSWLAARGIEVLTPAEVLARLART
ncbi:MAG: putative toxin-antitoxin system toxin component, PIN family [Chloroflexota bacterium]